MTLTIDDVIALRANCDDYVNAFKALEQSKLDFQRAEDNLMSNLPAVGFRVPLRAVYYAARLLELPKPILYCV